MYKASAQTPYCLSGPGPEIEVCGYSQTRPHTSHSYVHTNTYSCAILCRHPQVPLICINKHMYTHACTPTCTQLVFTVPHTQYLTLTVAYTHTHELTWHTLGTSREPVSDPEQSQGLGWPWWGKGRSPQSTNTQTRRWIHRSWAERTGVQREYHVHVGQGTTGEG